MTCAPSMPLFCGDYLADTKHLTLEQHGAYMLLLMITWRNNGRALPDDDDLLARYLAITKDRWQKKIKPALAPLFDLSGGTWRSLRLEHEWQYVQERIAAKRAAGAMGGRPRKNGPQNAPDSPAPSRENFSSNGDANHLKDNETLKPNGSGSVSDFESTHPPSSAYAEAEEDEDAGARAVVIHVAQQVAAMAGFVGPVDKRPDLDIVAGWLKEGADPDVDIIQAVAVAMNRTTQVRIRTFGYFSNEVETHRRARLAPKPEKSNVLPYRSSAQQRRGSAGCATGGVAAGRVLTRILAKGD
jgi:uncharacterized protein YdaU (DUF1376 family)